MTTVTPATTTSALMFAALAAEAQADILAARATLAVYFERPAGIGEHPQHLEEMKTLLDALASAEDRQDMIDKHLRPVYGLVASTQASS
jgi:hypothetical protein